MAIVFTEGFDYYRNITELYSNTWSSLQFFEETTNISLIDLNAQPQHKRFPESKKCIFFEKSQEYIYKYSPASSSDFILGMAFKFTQETSSHSTTISPTFVSFMDEDGRILLSVAAIFSSGENRLRILNEEGNFAGETNTSAFTTGNWHYLEIEGTVSSQSTIKLYVDNNNVGTFTNVDTLNPSDSSKKVFYIQFSSPIAGSTSYSRMYLDDIYFLDTASGGPATRLGPIRLDFIGFSNTISNNFQVVGDTNPVAAINDISSSKYITTDVTNTSAKFTVANIPHNPSQIYNVNLITRVAKIHPSVRKTEITIFDDNALTNYELKNTEKDVIQRINGLSPPSGGSWTKTKFENLKVKIRKKL